MEVKMFNGNVLTTDTTKTFEEKGGIKIATGMKEFKKLIVVKGEGFEPGEQLIVKKAVGTQIEIGEETFVVVNARDIILVL